MVPIRLTRQQQVDEGGRRGEELHPVLLDGGADQIGRPVRDRHDTTRVGENVEERVHAPDVVEEQKRERAQRVPGNLELLQERNEVVDRRFARPGGARREQDEPGMARASNPRDQLVRRLDAGVYQLRAIVARDRDRGFDLSDLAELGFLRLYRGRQGDDDGALVHQSQEEGDRGRRKIGLQAHHRARRQPSVSQEPGPRLHRVHQPCVRGCLVQPDHGLFVRASPEHVAEKVDVHHAPEAFTW